jgi:hypothetical protein
VPRRRLGARGGPDRERAAVHRLRSLAAAALAAAALAGCAGDDRDAAPEASATELLAQAADRLREQATFSFESRSVRTRADRPDDPETYAEVDGALDLERGRGRATLVLDLGLPDSGSQPGLDDPIKLRWDRRTLEAEIDGEARRLPREQARETGGLIGRLPDEPEALVELLELAMNARLLDAGTVAFVVDARRAGRAGVPAEVAPAAAEGRLGAELPFEAEIGDDGLPRRISYRIEQEPTAALPARTIEVTYDLADVGEPVSGLEFTSQAG